MRHLEELGGDYNHVEMYHAHMDKDSDSAIPREFLETGGHVRCLISTIAFGLGMQVEDINFVIHWGPPTSVLDYFQEIGRCARNGMPGRAILYKPPNTVRSDRIDASMMDIIKMSSHTCIRYTSLKYLKLSAMSEDEIKALCYGPNCCSYCDTKTSA